MSAFRRRLMMMYQSQQDNKIYATRVLDNVQLNYQGTLKAKNEERVYEFKIEVGKTYAISQQSDVPGYCRSRGWSTIQLEINGQSYKDDLVTIGCSTALSNYTFNTLSDRARIFVAKAEYLYAYNNSITTEFSNQEIYLELVE